MASGQRDRVRDRGRREGPLREFVAELHAMDPPLPRVPGTAVFLNPSKGTTPLALRANVEHNHVLHERVVIITVQSDTVPRVRLRDPSRSTTSASRTTTSRMSRRASASRRSRRSRKPSAWPPRRGLECDIDVESPTYFLSRRTIRVTDAAGMCRWRKRLFALSHIAANPIEYFGLSAERTITMGSQVPL